MPSRTPNRRRLLATAGGVLAAALAGCNRTETSTSDATPGPPSDAVTDPPTVTVRRDDPRRFVDPGEEGLQTGFALLVDRADVESLSLTAEPPGAAALRSFLDATDFDAACVALYEAELAECYRRRVEFVAARDDEFEAQFCRSLRPADVACGAAAEDAVLTAIRVPRAYEAAPRSLSLGNASDCPRWVSGRTTTATGDQG